MVTSRSRLKRASSAPRPRPGDPEPWTPARRALPAALVVVGVAVFANGISLPFVFDDHGSVLENPFIARLQWPDAFDAPVQSALAGRPVVSLSLALNHSLSGLSPAGYHAWNLGLHVLCALALFGVLRRTFALPALAPRFGRSAEALSFASALVWLVHPLQTELIGYVTQRTESTMALFYLLTLYCAVGAMTTTSPRRAVVWQAMAGLSCVLGAGSKESIATAPVMVLLYDAVFLAGSLGAALRSRPRLYAALAVSWIVLAAMVAPGPRSRSAGFSSGVSPWTYLSNQPELIVIYLKLSLWPAGQVFDYGLPRPLPVAQVLPYAAIVVSLLVATAVAWRRQRELAFLGTWFFLTLAPTSSIVPIATEVGAERRMYLPLMALIVAAVVGVHQVVGARAGWSRARRVWVQAACLVAVSAVLAALTIRRNEEYSSELGLWQTVLERRPHGRAHFSLGLELRRLGRRDEAIGHYRLALSDTPEAHYAIAFELEADGKYEQASEQYREFLARKPDAANAPGAYVRLGRSLAATGRLDAARDAFSAALAMRPRDLDARAGLADVLLRQERYDQAIAAYQELLNLGSVSAGVYANLGIALAARDREGEAVPFFERAVQLAPANAGLRRNLANALAASGRLEEAVEQYRRAIAVTPSDADLFHGLGLVLRAQGRLADSVAALRRAIELEPGHAEARSDLSEVLAALNYRPTGR